VKQIDGNDKIKTTIKTRFHPQLAKNTGRMTKISHLLRASYQKVSVRARRIGKAKVSPFHPLKNSREKLLDAHFSSESAL